MNIDFSRGTALFKALADETRVRIVDILSCGELCACDILYYFNISQPTLSHHLNVLVESGLVIARPEGKWTHYSLDVETFAFIERFIKDVSRKGENCPRKKTRRNCK